MNETDRSVGAATAAFDRDLAVPAGRTKGATPISCAVCGAEHQIKLAAAGPDAPCPACGCLLREGSQQAERLCHRLSEAFGVGPEEVAPDTLISDVADDSLARVELVMELEDELEQQGADTRLSTEEVEQIRTVGDALRLLIEKQRPAGD